MPIDDSVREFTCVFIPHDEKLPIKEIIVPVKEGEAIECLTNYIKQEIIQKEKVRNETITSEQKSAERAVIAAQIQAEIAKNPQYNINITDEIIDQIFNMHNVDAVPLQINKPENNYIAVNLYVDDQGSAKKLPNNLRASNICMLFGIPMQVMGDAWVARYMDDDDNFKRMDFKIDDFAGDWVTQVRNKNIAMAQVNAGSNSDIKKTMTSKTKVTHICADGRLKCTNVGKFRCSKCRNTYYCNLEHQKADWMKHKYICKKK